MATLNIILTIVLVLCSIVLITAVLMQQSKSGGLGESFGGATQSFTARGQRASKEAKLQKITVYSAIVIGILAIAIMIIE
ncbi:MAG: preprotein translocase subunit SecG [Christensenellaceae bacterium]|nr:preprotein translocase subunit SecG [Christensenellaceae bacterium]